MLSKMVGSHKNIIFTHNTALELGLLMVVVACQVSFDVLDGELKVARLTSGLSLVRLWCRCLYFLTWQFRQTFVLTLYLS